MMVSEGLICGFAIGVIAGIILMRKSSAVQDAVKKGEKMLEQGKKDLKNTVKKQVDKI